MQPDYNDKVKISSIKDKVNISWDSAGVIHIVGKNIDDVIFSSGYAIAMERLWQMDITRRLAKAQLSEIFGKETLDIDRLMATIDLKNLTDSIYANISYDSKKWLQSYSEGINAYIEKCGNDLPIEYILLNIKPQRWSPQDCLLQNRLMAWFLNFNWKADLFYWRASEILSERMLLDILPGWSNYPEIVSGANVDKVLFKFVDISRQIEDLFGLCCYHCGSNSWVVAPQKSASGHAMLANDPHLSIQFPSLWIELHLQSPEIDVAGFALPGSPGIVIGRNKNIAWGLTNGMIDDCDYFVEKIDTVKGIYIRNGKEKPLRTRDKYIKVKDAQDYYLINYYSDHGPIINSIFSEIKPQYYFSMKWTGWEHSDELNTFISLAYAKNWSDFTNALRSYAVPAQNFVYADNKGKIGYRLGGLVPIRSYKSGLIPQLAYKSGISWKSKLTFNDMPTIYNPEKGWIITANNKIKTSKGIYLSELWEPPYRAIRIEQLLEAKEKVDFSDMQQIQYDSKNLLAENIVPIISKHLNSVPIEDTLDENVRLLLNNWNYEMDKGDIAPTIYETIQYFLIQNIFKDKMGELFNTFLEISNFYIRIFNQVFQKEDSEWFDDLTTEKKENKSDIIEKSYKQALLYLKENISEDLEDWQWGQLHKLEFKHVLGRVPVTKQLFNRGPFQVSGTSITVNVGTYNYNKPFEMIIGPSFRFLVNWENEDRYWSILPGGNSGNFLSNYYDNQILNWVDGKVKIVSFLPPRTKNVINILPTSK